MEDEKFSNMSPARAVRVRASFGQVDALSDKLKSRIALLDDDELAVLQSVKEKLNAGLEANLKAAADTIGGFVW
jgi:hypothetical protein